jgi:hypothetical protein
LKYGYFAKTTINIEKSSIKRKNKIKKEGFYRILANNYIVVDKNYIKKKNF